MNEEKNESGSQSLTSLFSSNNSRNKPNEMTNLYNKPSIYDEDMPSYSPFGSLMP
jgi:hypothetical protein